MSNICWVFSKCCLLFWSKAEGGIEIPQAGMMAPALRFTNYWKVHKAPEIHQILKCTQRREKAGYCDGEKMAAGMQEAQEGERWKYKERGERARDRLADALHVSDIFIFSWFDFFLIYILKHEFPVYLVKPKHTAYYLKLHSSLQWNLVWPFLLNII